MEEAGNVKETIRLLQTYIYNILCDVDDFCNENHITYYLSGGTCLGAVRHKGFIPWDDDADIMMPREDYERFLKLFAQNGPEKYVVLSLYTDERWSRPSARIYNKETKITQQYMDEGDLGIFIDVIPIDGLPANKLHRYFLETKVRILAAVRNTHMRTGLVPGEPHYYIKRIIWMFTRSIDPRKIAVYLDNYVKKYKFESSAYVGATLACHYGYKEIIKKEYMDRAEYAWFCERRMPIPIGYKQYLTNLYGDYMTIPKDAEQKGYSHFGWTVKFNDYEK